MYKYISETENLISELITNYNFKEKSQEFYRNRITKFFNEYMSEAANENKSLNTISYYDIDTHLRNLKNSDADKVNHYSALKCFFVFTYNKGITQDVMSQVTKPTYEKSPNIILDEERYKKLVKFITNRENNIKERLVLGLFLFTGLSRKYIASLKNNQFVFEDGVYYLDIWKEESEIKLPLKAELQILVNEYVINIPDDMRLNKVLDMDENTVSTYIGNLTKKATGKKFTPTILSNTFVSKALANGNYIWEVSKLTLESVSTIEQHVNDIDNLMYRQTSILNSF
jgi:site-specific recombinase XerD